MTVLTRGGRSRRSSRRPGWLLLTVLLVLAIAASSALVFTDRVELLKLAVILALWAAVVAAFVSVIYRRQSDMDQAKARDLKLVYDLQLDREISARREYELTVESHLRRELASELRAQAADEVAALRAELAALRANLEILFDADLGHRPAIETERTTVRAYSDWARDSETTGRVASSRIDTEEPTRTSTPAPRKARSSTCRPNRTRPSPNGRRRTTAAPTAGRPRRSRRTGDRLPTSRRSGAAAARAATTAARAASAVGPTTCTAAAGARLAARTGGRPVDPGGSARQQLGVIRRGERIGRIRRRPTGRTRAGDVGPAPGAAARQAFGPAACH